MPTAKGQKLKEQVVDEAFKLIEEQGLDKLSLRDIARRLGVSHQAPYRHFPSRDHILAAVISKCFETFAEHLEARASREDAFQDLGQMGVAYLEFATQFPLHYRLMFNSALPDFNDHPDMLDKAQHAFSLLHNRIDTMKVSEAGPPMKDAARHDAMFIWSTLHGFASLMQSDALASAGMSDDERAAAYDRLFHRLGTALYPKEPQ